MPMRVLITGIAGHLGSALADWIQANHAETRIVGIDNLSSGFRENVPEGVEFIPGSVSHTASHYPSAFSRRFDAVFHFASFAAECLSPFVRRYTISQVWGETATLLNQLLADPDICGRLVYASSIAVYGAGVAPFDESSPCVPNDPYGAAKLAAEHDVRIAGEQHGLDWCIVRPHNIYGPGQNLWDRHRNVFGLWMRAALEQRPAVIFGDGQQRRAFTYIDDILPCLWEAALSPRASRQTINLGGSRPWTIGEASQALADVLQAEAPRFERQPARHEVRDSWCSTAKSRELLGYEDRTGEYAGIDAMWRWAKQSWADHPERRRRSEPFEIELCRGLPVAWRTSAREASPTFQPSP